MRKKFLLIITTLFLTFMFNQDVFATECQYIGANKYGGLKVNYNIKVNNEIDGKASLEGVIDSSDSGSTSDFSNKEEVKNWEEKIGDVSESGKRYYFLNKTCPPYVVVSYSTTGARLYVAATKDDRNYLVNLEKNRTGHQGFQTLVLAENTIIDRHYEIFFRKNNEKAYGMMSSVGGKYLTEPINLPVNKFTYEGYILASYRVQNNGKWLCEDKNKDLYYSNSCPEDEYYELLPGATNVNLPFELNVEQVYLYAQWIPASSITPIIINSDNLGKNVCTNKGYVWNIKEYNGETYEYCNTDNLVYVYCGDAKDIPMQAPSIVAFFVNLLKIATPIILIIFGIISLLKALAASNEDELKKARKILVKRIIGAVFVFLVITIVQFVIGAVADTEVNSELNNETEAKNLSSCLTCFLNNDCVDTAYYKTNYQNEYHYFSLTSGEEITTWFSDPQS